jgi:hypothetical protein
MCVTQVLKHPGVVEGLDLIFPSPICDPESMSLGQPCNGVAVGDVPTDVPQLREAELGDPSFQVPCHGRLPRYNRWTRWLVSVPPD